MNDPFRALLGHYLRRSGLPKCEVSLRIGAQPNYLARLLARRYPTQPATRSRVLHLAYALRLTSVEAVRLLIAWDDGGGR